MPKSATPSISQESHTISYKIKESAQARSIRISVYADKGVVVTVPAKQYSFQKFILRKKVEAFVKSKAGWILKTLQKFEKIRQVNPNRVVIKGSKRDYQKYKELARTLVLAKIEKFNRHYQFEFKKVTIRNQKSRWGSCSKKGNLNFNYKIVHLADELANYLVVHELCHLKEFNHGEKFWNLVGETIPDYKKLRKQLKGIG